MSPVGRRSRTLLKLLPSGLPFPSQAPRSAPAGARCFVRTSADVSAPLLPTANRPVAMRTFASQAAASANPAPLLRRLSARQGLAAPRRPFASGAGAKAPKLAPSAVSRELSSQVAQDDDLLFDAEDSADFDFTEEEKEPRKAMTFADTLSDDDGTIMVDAGAEILDESLKVSNPEFGLSQNTIDAVNDKGIEALFPIQAAVMKPIMAGRDVIGRAKTGSGKTLAFSIPIIENIMQIERPQRGRAPLTLVLAPTRELAKQVEKEFDSVAPTLSCGCFYGGVSIRDQSMALRKGLDVVVGTPGRIIDLIGRGDLDLSQIKYVIMDEADQMLSFGFCEDVEQILESVPTQRQTLLFSATLPKWVLNITRRFLDNPVTVDTIGESDTGRMSDTITALACQVTHTAKMSVLVDLISVYGKGEKTIVFTQTKRGADEVAASLSKQFACEALHGDISQALREKTLNRFRESRINVLVATDVAARGLDIPNVDLVVHYELPQEAEGFLHRSGRTGRAGRKGTAIALLTHRDIGSFRNILRQTKAKVDMVGPPGPVEVMRSSSLAVANRLDQVDPEVIKFFMPAAEKLLQVKDPHHSLAASLAALSGFTEVPKPRSLITQEEGVQTLRLMADRGLLSSPGSILSSMSKVEEDAGRLIGRVRMVRGDDGKEGAAFDVPGEEAAKFLAHAGLLASQGLVLDVPKSLPADFSSHNDRGGRGARDGGRNRYNGGGGYNQRGRRTDRSQGYSKSSGGYNDGGDGGGYRGRSNSSGRGYQGRNDSGGGGYQGRSSSGGQGYQGRSSSGGRGEGRYSNSSDSWNSGGGGGGSSGGGSRRQSSWTSDGW